MLEQYYILVAMTLLLEIATTGQGGLSLDSLIADLPVVVTTKIKATCM